MSVPGADAMEIAERFRVFFSLPHPTSEEGVELAVRFLAQEIENATLRGRAEAIEEAARIADGHPSDTDCKFADFEDPEILRGCVEVIAGRIRALARK